MMKKQKTLHPSSAGRLMMMINDLPDVLLTEILARLHSHRCAITCKSVCKQWYSLISAPDFDSRFIANHAQKHQKHSLIGISVGTPVDGSIYSRQRCIRFIGSQGLESAWTHSTSEIFGENSARIRILATDNDLILCDSTISTFRRGSAWYVHNPSTMEWFALPLLPFGYFHRAGAISCETFHLQRDCRQGRQFGFQDSGRRFKVICIGNLTAYYYCSETNRWSELIRLENEFVTPYTNFVAYRGKFYWTTETVLEDFDVARHIVVYDPSGDGSEKRLCELPAASCRLVRLGVCQGSMRMMRTHLLQNNRLGLVFMLCVWEMEDEDEHGKVTWKLKHSIRSDQMSSQDSRLPSGPKSKMKLLQFHPVDEEIVYMDFCDCIVSCNLRTRDLEVVSEPPSHFRPSNPSTTLFDVSNMVYPLAHPWWPAPLFP
ncbi:hypothetical protein Tsubulata_037612 [Turnera subulata]|uniref:F-box domain-containing protein n=1 Tax=Turnera subulata TaxID=218843 RepID=A0A9Q0J7Q8_9ROSI|nr:hypothetical protein Tsubulata_037612 [Turnera subulata]